MDTEGVYIAECQGRYKIGRSRSIDERIKSLNTASPFEVSLIASFPTSVSASLEKYLHSKFEKCNIQGEWFELEEEHLDQIRLLAHSFPDQPAFDWIIGEKQVCNNTIKDLRSMSDDELEELGYIRFWICPVCDFLTESAGICNECQKDLPHHVVKHILYVIPPKLLDTAG